MYPVKFGHAVLKRAIEFGRMNLRQTIDDVLIGLGKRGEEVGGS